MKAYHLISVFSAAVIVTLALPLAALAAEKVYVNLLNFNNVETHIKLDRHQLLAGGINTFKHNPNMVEIDKQTTIAMNRDTLHSLAVVNLSKPLTITLPENSDRPRQG
jgi:hypothetical protein